MPIRLQTYQSQVRAASPKPVVNAPMQRTAQNGTRRDGVLENVNKLAQTAGSIYAKEVRREAEEEKEVQIATDILQEMTDYSNDIIQFEETHMSQVKGKDARNTLETYEQFHKKQYETRSQKIAELGPRADAIWQQQSQQIRRSSLARGMAFSQKQEKLYRIQTIQERASLYLRQLAGANDDRSAALQEQLFAEIDALNPGQDMASMKTSLAQQGIAFRIQSALEDANYTEARRILETYKENLGSPYESFDALVESVRVTTLSEEYEHLAEQSGTGVALTQLDHDPLLEPEDKLRIKNVVEAIERTQIIRQVMQKKEFIEQHFNAAHEAIQENDFPMVEKNAQNLDDAGCHGEAEMLRNSIDTLQSCLIDENIALINEKQAVLVESAMHAIDTGQMTQSHFNIVSHCLDEKKRRKLKLAYEGNLRVSVSEARQFFDTVHPVTRDEENLSVVQEFQAFHDFLLRQTALLGKSDIKTIQELTSLYRFEHSAMDDAIRMKLNTEESHNSIR